jgi:N-acetylglucosamine-6-phosphate deacetylase
VHAALVRLVAAARPDRLVLVTDAIDATGMPDGPTMLGGQAVDIDGGVARLRRTGALAGSTLTMDEALRRSIVEVGLDVVTAVRAASTNAARLLGLDGRIGSISPGRIADLVVLDEAFRVQQVLVAGEGGRSDSTPALAVFD